MKKLFNRSNIQSYIVILLISIFGIFYWQTVMSLPLFGDATIHGFHAKNLLDNSWRELEADYPPLYYYGMVVFSTFFGETGFKLVPYISFILLLLSLFLLVRYVTKNYYLALLSIIFVACSPKIILYSAKMYQEILLSALIIYCIYLLVKFIDTKNRMIFIMLAFFVGVTLSIKQQGLYILYVSMIATFTALVILRKSSNKHLLLIILIPLLVGIPFYGVLFHTRGALQPGSNEFGAFRVINKIGQNIFAYQPEDTKEQKEISVVNELSNDAVNNNPSINNTQTESDKLENKLASIEDEHLLTAHSRAESRHIWPTDVFLNFDKFNEANNLYLLIWQGRRLETPELFYFLFVTLVLGFIYSLIHFRKYSTLIIFTVIFLTINYVLFVRNNDQQRYHVFIPIFLLVFNFILLNTFFRRISTNKIVMLSFTFISSIIIFSSILVPRIMANQLWKSTQLYSSSDGGIASVKETGEWIDKNTAKNSKLGQQCGNETQYYANRKVISDWRIDFLEPKDLEAYFKKNSIEYFVIYKSQIIEDKEWSHLCWVPLSFHKTMEKNFKRIYTSKVNDIYVYETYLTK